MKEIRASELKEIQLSILDSIANFCEENNIRYFLAYGTLIGAVRHQGFIPWDDDVDLMMPREDFERFCKIYNEYSENYKVSYSGNDSKWFINFAKVQDIRTRYQENYSCDTDYGVFIDIFPIDGYANSFQKHICYYLFRIIHFKSLRSVPKDSILKKVCIKILHLILSFLSMRMLLGVLERESKRKAFNLSPLVYYFSEKTKPYERWWFDDYLMVDFEDKKYRIPQGFHDILTLQYGNYMKLPPKEEQVNKHSALIWWK